jgi:endonuclease/exonuclease/phosphatase family metal-dependent hydrolase
MRVGLSFRLGLVLLLLPDGLLAAGAIFRVATYNLENYFIEAQDRRHAKTAEARAQVRESIRQMAPDVIALQEVGGTNAFEELRQGLRAAGLDLPYAEYVPGWDPAIHTAILSRFPIIARHPHTNDVFLLSGRRFHVSRGIGDVEIEVNPNYRFTLLTAHLKSRLQTALADETELRLQEAKVLREKADDYLALNPEANLVVLGDFNDTIDSATIHEIIGRGRHKLIDTRPGERRPGDPSGDASGVKGRTVTWTHFYPKADTYSRVDFILLSRGMAREWVKEDTYILASPEWGMASDHRPLVAAFEAKER